MKGQIAAENAKDYILAGNATVTLVSKKTGTRFTYKIRVGKNAGDPHFIRLLTGPDNTRSYSYMGRIVNQESYIHDRKNRAGSANSPAAKGFLWVWTKLLARQFKDVDANVEIWHEGKCGKCGRKLTVPESIATGIGPVCAGKSQPTTRSHNVIKNHKKLQRKSNGNKVVSATKLAQPGTWEVEVKSATSGEVYNVALTDGLATHCSCEWGTFRPSADPRVCCSHAMTALKWLEQTGGRTLSFWPESDEQAINRQHRPARRVGDNVTVTSRQMNSMLQNPIEKAKIEAQAAREREARLDWEFAQQEIAQDQAAEEAKMAMEMSMVARLKARAG